MITGELKNKIDSIWDAFAAGGLVNPLEVIEQITYLLFTSIPIFGSYICNDNLSIVAKLSIFFLSLTKTAHINFKYDI